jgi:hypothetical protein
LPPRAADWALAILGLPAHLWASRGDDYFRDEMYFIVCGERRDWGFIDQPPLIPTVAATMHRLFPGSLVMLRLLPARAHAATIVLAAATARQLGGGVWAQAIAALCVLTGGVFLGIGTTLSTGALEPLAGLFCAYALIRIIRGKEERWCVARQSGREASGNQDRNLAPRHWHDCRCATVAQEAREVIECRGATIRGWL